MVEFLLNFMSLAEAEELAKVIAKNWKLIQRTIPTSIGETLYMTLVSTAFAILLGLPLGILLVVGEKKGVLPLPSWLMKLINVLVNLLRTVPFLILLVILIPFTRMVVGSPMGVNGMTVPLVIAAFPYVARLVETSIREVNPNIIETAQSMGATPMQIILRVMLPESVPSLINSFTVAVTTIMGYTTMSFAVAGGGLGSLAYEYGYIRSNNWIMYPAIAILVVIMQILQSFGTWLARKCDKRLKH